MNENGQKWSKWLKWLHLLKELLEHIAHSILLCIGHGPIFLCILSGIGNCQQRPRICSFWHFWAGHNVNIEIDLNIVFPIVTWRDSVDTIIFQMYSNHNIVDIEKNGWYICVKEWKSLTYGNCLPPG